MKPYLALLLVCTCSLLASFRCTPPCISAFKSLDATRGWLPEKGKTFLSFVSNTGSIVDFKLRVVDTIRMEYNGCGEMLPREYKTASLYLNSGLTDSIYFSLSGDMLSIIAISNNVGNIGIMPDVFYQAEHALYAKKFSNYTIGSKTYNEVILIPHTPNASDNIDSVFIANNAGIVGFKYSNNRYSLQ